MWAVLRSIGLVFIGVVIAMVVFTGAEFIDARVYNFLDGVELTDQQAVRDKMREALPTLPIGAFLIVLLGYFVGTFCGAWVAARLTRHRWINSPWPMSHAMIVGLVLLIAGLYDIFTLPHPAWYFPCYFVVFPLAAVLAGWVVTTMSRVNAGVAG